MAKKTATAAPPVEPAISDDDKAEQILWSAVLRASAEGGEPRLSFDDTRFLATKMGWNADEQTRQFARVTRAAHFQSVAGDSAKRAALNEAAAAAIETFEIEDPKLEAQIIELQKQRDELRRNRDALAKRQSDVSNALDALTKLAPDYVRQRANHDSQLAIKTLGVEANELKAEIHTIECMVDPTRYANSERHVEGVRLFDRSFVVEDRQGAKIIYRLSPEWESHAKELESRLPAMRESLADLESQLESEIEKANSLLEIYWR